MIRSSISPARAASVRMTSGQKLGAATAAVALLALLVGCSSGATTPVSHVSAQPSPHTAATGSATAGTAGQSVAGPVQQSAAVGTGATGASASGASAPGSTASGASAAATACASTPAATKQILVSITQQHLWACSGTVLFLDTPVTTGASALTNVHDATPTGTMRINGKVRNTVLAGHDVNGSWHDVVTYWMPFSGGDGFHDSPWQTFPLGSPLYTSQGSHGCVHVGLTALATLFDWTPVGTAVIVRN